MASDEHLVFREYLDAVGLNAIAAADALGLNPTEWHTLSALGLAGHLTAGEIAQVSGLTSGAATRLIDRLERAGFVRRVADPTDRRRSRVEPVPTAARRLGPILEPSRRLVGEVLDRYSPEQRAVLFDFFARVAPAFRAATAEIRAADR